MRLQEAGNRNRLLRTKDDPRAAGVVSFGGTREEGGVCIR